jgi:hypothetical protein
MLVAAAVAGTQDEGNRPSTDLATLETSPPSPALMVTARECPNSNLRVINIIALVQEGAGAGTRPSGVTKVPGEETKCTM